MGKKKQDSIKVMNLTDPGRNSTVNYLQGLMIVPSVRTIKIKGEYCYNYSPSTDQKLYNATFSISPSSDSSTGILRRVAEGRTISYAMDFSCYKEDNAWGDPQQTIDSQIRSLIGKIETENFTSSLKADERNNEKSGSLEFTLSKI